MKNFLTICLVFLSASLLAQHPLTFFTNGETALIKKDLDKYALLKTSFQKLKNEVDQSIGKDIDVPVPKDAAGGYTHEKHKSNYFLMFNSGILYNLTGDAKYLKLTRDILLKYAVLNPGLKKHPQATSSSPGHIFWQALNDANWLVYTGMAYDLVYDGLTKEERKKIEDGAFKPEVDYITHDLESWFNLLHNHGVWACAGVGIVGIATGNTRYTDMALYGTKNDGKSGFIAQLDNLFSPDGYYTEGPYYVRYAILPFYLFANALNHARPELKIFEHRDRILQKALLAGLQQTNIDGEFFPLNDALKEKDFTTNELVTTIDIAWQVYGADKGLLTVAKKQDRVLVNKGGASIAAAIATEKNIPDYYSYKAVEFTDGSKGAEGGVGLLRSGTGKNLTTLIFKYPSHGLSHGHFDRLNINLFDQGNEILQDYGSVRFISVEQKYGGRYLPENETWASQTIAHNTVVVDENSQYGGKEKEAENYHAEKLFSSLDHQNIQVISAKETHAYKDVELRRTVYLLRLPNDKKVIVDIFQVNSANEHQYDLPFQYSGQVIQSSVPYKSFVSARETLGTKNGYQFLWKEAEANANNGITQMTFLNKKTFYTISSLTTAGDEIFFARLGANDPNFNLRTEPSWIIRKKGNSEIFINVVEIHGTFNSVEETSTNAYPSVKNIELLDNSRQVTAVRIYIDEKTLLVAQTNDDYNSTAKHRLEKDQTVEWSGPYYVLYEGKQLH